MTIQSRYLDEVRRRVLVYDGAMGTQILNLGLSAEDYGGASQDGCPEVLAVTRPDAIRDIHRAYLAAGADVVETDTFTGTRLKLDDYKLGDRTHEINSAAARLARAAADEFSTPERPRFVAGSMGPTGMLPSSDDPSLSNITYQQLAEQYREQAAALIDGHRRHPPRLRADRARPADPGAGDAGYEWAHAAWHRCRRRVHHRLSPGCGHCGTELLDGT
jgi:5-methyltetrahydrofolate--homocysteine methyltransferase